MARLNPDLRYFFFLEKPENGVNSYFTNPQNMARLLRTLMRMPFASSAIWGAVCATRCMRPPLLPSGFPFLLTRCSPSLTGLTDSDWSGGSVWMPRRVNPSCTATRTASRSPSFWHLHSPWAIICNIGIRAGRNFPAGCSTTKQVTTSTPSHRYHGGVRMKNNLYPIQNHGGNSYEKSSCSSVCTRAGNR